MSIFKKINEIAEICEAVIKAACRSHYINGQPVSADKWREHIEAIKADAKKSQEENKPAEKQPAWKKIISILKEDEEEETPNKKHWTQYRPSGTNQHFQRTYGSRRNLNANQQAQDETRQSYNNYLTNVAKQEDSRAVEMYNQAKQEVYKLISLAKQGKVSWGEVNKAQRAMQKLNPGATSEVTKSKSENNQRKRYGK